MLYRELWSLVLTYVNGDSSMVLEKVDEERKALY
jgi:hypothetical protein